jgi:two-component system, NtrC family, response regulator AlgB
LAERPSQIELATRSSAMHRTLEALWLAARTDAPIMLRAEIGSEVAGLARRVHDHSSRRDRAFLSLACPSITELSSKALSEAAGGTLFLDEIGDLAGDLQARLVHLLDELSAEGDTTRLISATKRDLDQEVASRRFREDLFFRLNVIEIRVLPLRERPEDILPLARDLIASLSADLGRRTPVLSEDAAAMLLHHRWPANLRELKNVIERALLIWPAEVVEPEAFTEITNADVHRRPRVGDDVTLRDLARDHIVRVMTRARSLRDAAAILGVDDATLWRRRKQYEREREVGNDRGRER